MKLRSEVHLGNCLELLASLPDNYLDSIVTDPPYGLSFMSKQWDYDVPSVEIWRECLRVLKPGGHLLAFAGTRTQHRMAVRIEDAGFEIRDLIAWVYGEGFPKSRDVSQAIDKTGLGTDTVQKYIGWGTGLKPALEPITVARKPLVGTVADNVLTYGTGALNIDGCRVGAEVRVNHPGSTKPRFSMRNNWRDDAEPRIATGRWPANFIHDGSEEVVGLFPSPHGAGAAREAIRQCDPSGNIMKLRGDGHRFGDTGSAARFFYCAKSSPTERGADNHHPTVKPLALIRYLQRLVTPAAGLTFDPFTGSGTARLAAHLEGFHFLGAELQADYHHLQEQRYQDLLAGKKSRRRDTAPAPAEATKQTAYVQTSLF